MFVQPGFHFCPAPGIEAAVGVGVKFLFADR
jgi:hypothetical protein